MGRIDRQLFSTKYHLKGLTLIELLIAIAIVAIVATIGIATINPLKQLQKGRDTQRKADIAKVQQVLELYRSDNGKYPLTNQYPACGTALTGPNGSTYLQSTPCDPLSSTTSYPYTSANGISYTIYACLENTTDPDGATACSVGSKFTGIRYTRTNP